MRFRKGFIRNSLILDGKIIGQIEFAPAEASGYPILGEDIVVMNCIWVLERVKGHDFGKLLLNDMLRSENHTAGFATIALENHWSPWFRKREMERLGFKPIDSIKVTHRIKRKSKVFTIYLMWMPTKQKAQPPTWDKQKLLEGEPFCLAHPLYHSQTWKGNVFEAK